MVLNGSRLFWKCGNFQFHFQFHAVFHFNVRVFLFSFSISHRVSVCYAPEAATAPPPDTQAHTRPDRPTPGTPTANGTGRLHSPSTAHRGSRATFIITPHLDGSGKMTTEGGTCRNELKPPPAGKPPGNRNPPPRKPGGIPRSCPERGAMWPRRAQMDPRIQWRQRRRSRAHPAAPTSAQQFGHVCVSTNTPEPRESQSVSRRRVPTGPPELPRTSGDQSKAPGWANR